jgi:hypothetical protein
LAERGPSSRSTGYYTPADAGKYDLFVSSTEEDGGYYGRYVDEKLVLDDWMISKELLGMAMVSFDTNPLHSVEEGTLS